MSRSTVAGEAKVMLLCETFGISRQAYYAALRPRVDDAKVTRLPKRPRFVAVDVLLAAIREVLTRPDSAAWGVRKVWATLRREGMRVGRKRVWALMRANGLVLARDSEPGEPTRGHVAVPDPNRRIATDLTTTWTRKDGVVAIVPTMDCGCRSILALMVTKDQHGPAVLASVEEGLRVAFGSVENVPAGVDLRTDHGPQYTGADCEALVVRWGIEHTFAPVGRPTGNAVVERLIRTLKEEVVWLRDWESADELRTALDAWLIRYNTTRPHQSLDWLTPSEYRSQKLGSVALRAAA